MHILIYFASARLVARGAQTMYAIGTLRRHGLTGPLLWEVTRATFIARLTYASQAWWGLLDSQGRSRLEGVLKKITRGVSCQRLTRHSLKSAIQRMSGCSVKY